MRARIEGRESEPLFQMRRGSVRIGREPRDEEAQDGDVASSEAPSLGGQPGIEMRAAIDLEPFEEIAGEQPGERPQLFEAERLDSRIDRRRDVDRVHGTAFKTKRDPVVRRLDPSAVRFVENGPKLAQAPAEFAPRIVRDVPQEIAETAPPHRARSQREIREQSQNLAGRGKLQGNAVARDGKCAEQPRGDAAGRAVPGRSSGFHANSHAVSHVCNSRRVLS